MNETELNGEKALGLFKCGLFTDTDSDPPASMNIFLYVCLRMVLELSGFVGFDAGLD